jgi:ABC-type oligopeptide transport system ATPase subunit
MIETATLLKIMSKPAIQASVPLFKKISDEISYHWNDGFLDYFLNSLERYKEIKTLLHRQPTDFYDIYYPAKLSYENKTISTDSVKDLFLTNNFFTIIGDAGSGKSTLIRHLFISSLVESYKAPIFIALRDLDIKNSDLETFLRENILQNKLAPSDNSLNNLLAEGEFLFFLDGYDEINSENKHEITKNIEKFIDKYPKNNYILTSRPYSNIEYFKSFHNYRIADLSIDDRIAFVQQQLKNDVDSRLANKIIDSIKETNHNYIDSFLKNPLLLTLYIMTYSKNSSIPSSKYVFYRRVFDVLFAEHDSATKIGFEREIKTQLNQETLEKILQTFSFLSYFDSHFDFKKDYIFDMLSTIKTKNSNLKFKNNDFIEDMKLSIGLWVEDSGIYSFSHRSMQEYFASVFITSLSDKNKRSVYKKIVSFAMNRDFDIKNFLSLCYEMDREFFIKYYSLPILNKMKKLFIHQNGELNYKFPYLNDGFLTHKRREASEASESHSLTVHNITSELLFLVEVSITPDSYFSKYLNEVASGFMKFNEHKYFNKYIKVKDSEDKLNGSKEYFLPKGKDINEEYILFLDEIKIKDVLLKIVNELNGIESKFKKDIEEQKIIEDDFITMI